jgi:hypothetical protein
LPSENTCCEICQIAKKWLDAVQCTTEMRQKSTLSPPFLNGLMTPALKYTSFSQKNQHPRGQSIRFVRPTQYIKAMSDFFENLHQEVLRYAESKDAKGLSESFTNWVLELLQEDTIASWEIVNYRSIDGKSGIDAFSLSEDRAHLDVFISDYQSQQKTLSDKEINGLIGLATEFIKRSKRGFQNSNVQSEDAANSAAKLIFESQGSLVRERIFLLTNAQVGHGFNSKNSTDKLGFEVWDIDRIANHSSSGREVVKLDFENDFSEGGPIACVSVAEGTGEYRTLLTFFRGDVLARIYGTHSHKLLEQNVRVFLQAKGPINKGLQKTLEDAPGRFLAYNNGLCCTASKVELKTSEGGHAFLRSVTDFQIVNGGQTTSSLDLYNRKGNPDNLKRVWVQAKITVIHERDKVDEIVPLISRYANSQNKVSGADFSANGPFHRGLEKISRSTKTPTPRQTVWYYERAKGAYADERARKANQKKGNKKNYKPSEWEEEHPIRQKLAKTDVAKLEHCWDGNPFYACLGADKSFRKMAEQFESKEPVASDVYFRNLVAKAIIWNSIEDQFDLLKLKGCRSQTVAYSFAFLSVKSDKRINLDLIWEHQRCQPGLLEFVTTLCKRFHEILMTNNAVPDCPGAGNQLAKTEKYWKRFLIVVSDCLIPDSWKREWSAKPFEVLYNTEDGLAAEWERVRYRFIDDARGMGELAKDLQKPWIKSRSQELARIWAGKSWTEVTNINGFGPEGRRKLVDLFCAAFEASNEL